jgi:hypothetical protein
MRNSLFACPLLEFAEAISHHNGGRTWVYNFALDVWADTPWNQTPLAAMVPGGSNMTLAELGAFHGAEIPFIWNLFPKRDTIPSDLGNPMTAFNAFIGQNFCPAHSFKRTVANQVGCLWTNVAKCGAPRCTNSDCNIGTEWKTFGITPQYLNIHGRGEFHMRTVEHSGRQTRMPSAQQCRIWNGVRLPFHDFAGTKESRAPVEANARSGCAGISILVAAVLTALVR